MYDPDSTTFAQRIVLCCLVELAEAGRTPADAAEIRSVAKELLEAVEGQPVGSISEADAIRALGGLVEAELLNERCPEDRSPVGKGRPQYTLDVDSDQLRETLEEDAEIGSILSYR